MRWYTVRGRWLWSQLKQQSVQPQTNHCWRAFWHLIYAAIVGLCSRQRCSKWTSLICLSSPSLPVIGKHWPHLTRHSHTSLGWGTPPSEERHRQIPPFPLVLARQGTGGVRQPPAHLPEGTPLHDPTCQSVSTPDLPSPPAPLSSWPWCSGSVAGLRQPWYQQQCRQLNQTNPVYLHIIWIMCYLDSRGSGKILWLPLSFPFLVLPQIAFEKITCIYIHIHSSKCCAAFFFFF